MIKRFSYIDGKIWQEMICEKNKSDHIFQNSLRLWDLKYFARYGLILFLFLPFVFLFLVHYLLAGDERLSAKLAVVIPFMYALVKYGVWD